MELEQQATPDAGRQELADIPATRLLRTGDEKKISTVYRVYHNQLCVKTTPMAALQESQARRSGRTNAAADLSLEAVRESSKSDPYDRMWSAAFKHVRIYP